ncbi:catalase, partial [Phenoliferia sp. Uapishka_3]
MPPPSVINKTDGATYTTSQGAPVSEPYAAERIGRNGPLLLQDFHHIDLLAHFDRERVPERVIHAKGGGAHGTFEVTHDISDLTCADLFSKIGNKARATARFSTVGGESGSADTARDPRGFSVKLRTEEGNWDHVYNNTPVFFLRDPAKFPHFIHTQKRDPATHLKDADAFWDYATQNPESVHQFTILFGDRGVPDGWRFMHGYAGHAHKLVNKNGDFVYAQFVWQSDQGTKFLTHEEGTKLAGENPDYSTQDLREAIDRKEFPSWTLNVQVMTVEQAENFRYNILDLTKVWPHKEFPLRPIGKMTLNENPENYFAEIEQIAFSPSHTIPGVEPSADPVLQSRLFSYPDTQRHRLGTNYAQLPINAPIHAPANFQRDGAMAFSNQGSRPNYQSSIQPLSYRPEVYSVSKHEQFVGAAVLDLSFVTELDFEQPRALWTKVYNEEAKERFITNIAGHLGGVKTDAILGKVIAMFGAVSPDIGTRIAKAIGHAEVAPLKYPSSLRLALGVRVFFSHNRTTQPQEPSARQLRRSKPQRRKSSPSPSSARAFSVSDSGRNSAKPPTSLRQAPFMFLLKTASLAEAYGTPNPVGALILVVVNAILEVFFLCLVGWILARKGIVSPAAKKTLNKLNVSLFTPALLFSKVAFSLTPDKLKELSIIPVGFVILTCFSASVAYIFATVFRLKKGQRNFAIACTMFQNSNSLPIALMQSLIGEHMPLEWGPHDTKDQMLGRALSYLVLFSTLGIIVRWSIGVRLLTSAENDAGEDDPHSTNPLPVSDLESHESTLYASSTTTPLLSDSHSNANSRRSKPSPPPTTVSGSALTGALNGQVGKKHKKAQSIFQSFPNTPIPSTRTSVAGTSGGSENDDSDEEEEDEEWGERRGVGRRDEDMDIFEGAWRVRWERTKRVTAKVWRPIRKVGMRIGEFMTVPLWAALLSLFVACVPPLQHALNEAEPLKSAIKNAGNCSVPITLITLGAYFYRPAPPSSPPSEPFFKRLNPFIKHPRPLRHAGSGRPGETRTVLVAVVSRMIVVPIIMVPLFGWYAAKTVNVADDPVFVVVACLLIGSPTAITLAQITSSAAGDTFEKLISQTLFVSYAILTAPCTIALVLAALLIDRKQ